MATTGDITSNPVEFIYTGQRQQEIPRNFTHLTVQSSVKMVGLFPSDEMPQEMELLGRGQGGIILTLRELLQLPERDSIGGCYFGCGHNNLIVQVKLQEGLQVIGACAFLGCRMLRQVSVASTVEIIGAVAFGNCESLESLTLRTGLQTICKMAFTRCTSLPQVSLPSTVEGIEDDAFSFCKALLEVHLPSGLEALGAASFAHCESLLNVSLPSTVEIIGNRSFMGCKSLVDVELREGLQEIGESAFRDCTSLCNVRIPASTTRVGRCAFSECKNLLGVEFPANARAVLEGMCFYSCRALITVSLPSTMGEIEANFTSFVGCTSFSVEGLIDDYNDLQPTLRGRFTSLPIHELCYHSSTVPLVNLVNRIQDSSIDDKNSKDFFGMTPFHVLATSSKLRTDLLEVLLDEYPMDTLAQIDLTDHSMMDYLLMNESSTVTSLIELVLQRVLIARMERCGLQRWKDEMSLQIQSTDWSGNFETSRECLDCVLVRLASCAKVEMTSLLELALWKRKIVSFFDADNKKRRKVDRENCRTLSGVDEVIPNVIEYLWNDIGSEVLIDVSMIPYDVSWLTKADNEEGLTLLN